VARKLTLLATVVVMPGGLLALCAIACALLLMRSDGGRRALSLVKKWIPARVTAPLCKMLRRMRGEQLFLARSPEVRLR
jgi:hypothetical protein